MSESEWHDVRSPPRTRIRWRLRWLWWSIGAWWRRHRARRREARLAKLGFAALSDEQRRANLERNITLMLWDGRKWPWKP